ncbi:hypothetical protein [Chryseobacterium jejuense]|uniref:Uncharacterized protein n=1 Tax=Chryseobacterium jejuense TaxID=445960 RepID=A0A2X2VTR3_CHRJE|nr:hypothetical protein [Chryseobacterium jejuense]SDJ22826.1 hypothetical protein SAMN05421542_3087 [Chryseobacterium jejuense]SQB28673.1 Uncharacterised protein [Chryseobacterium jejuense]
MEKRIINILEQEYECYYLGEKWKIIHKGIIREVTLGSFYGVPFYIIFENIETVVPQLKTVIQTNHVLLSDIFPIRLILEELIEHQRNYWLDLYLDFIVEMDVLNQNIVKTLLKTKNNKAFTQPVRHKIRRVILTNNYEY